MRVLISGVAGFLGSHLCHRLKAEGHEVIGLDLVHRSDAWRLSPGPDTYLWQPVSGSLDGLPYIDAVIHCAAVTDVRMAYWHQDHAIQTNIVGTAELLNNVFSKKGCHFIQISTHSVYGKPYPVSPFHEDHPCRPTNIYGVTKKAQEDLALAYHASFGLPVTVLRLSLMYGEAERAGALVRTFIEKAIRGETITLDGGGLQTRDFNYVENAVDGIMATLSREGNGQVYNIPGSRDISIQELAERAVRLAGHGAVAYGPPREGEEGNIRLDSGKAFRELGYSPKIGFDEGFERTFQWVANRIS